MEPAERTGSVAMMRLLIGGKPSGQHTVGIHVHLSHTAATPIGMNVTAEVELIERIDRKLTFKVIIRDEAE